MTGKRLIERDPGALETINEVRALREGMQGHAAGIPGLVGRIAQIADSIGRELGENLVLKNASRRIKRDIDIVGWQKQTIQYDLSIDLMQREWDALAKRCLQGGEDTCFVLNEAERCEEQIASPEGEEAVEEQEIPPEAQHIIEKALNEDEAPAAWKYLRRAARMSRAEYPEVIGIAACELIERWGWVAERTQGHQDIKDLCGQEVIGGGGLKLKERGTRGRN